MRPTAICPMSPARRTLSDAHSAMARKRKKEIRVKMLMTVVEGQRARSRLMGLTDYWAHGTRGMLPLPWRPFA